MTIFESLFICQCPEAFLISLTGSCDKLARQIEVIAIQIEQTARRLIKPIRVCPSVLIFHLPVAIRLLLIRMMLLILVAVIVV